MINATKIFLIFFERMHLVGFEASSKAFSQGNRLYLHCRESSHALLTLDLVYHQTKTLRTLAQGRGSANTFLRERFANARHARIRRLAPCLRRHLPDDR